jgi:hypothetical protein
MLILAAAVEACTGNSGPPVAQTAPSNTTGTAVTLGTATVIQGFNVGGYPGSVIYPTGTGSVTTTVSATPPTGVSVLNTLRSSATSTTRAVAAASPTPTPTPSPLLYFAYSGTATLGGLPGISLTLPAAPATGTVFYEAQWNGTVWVTVGGAGTISGTTVTFNATTTSTALTASAPIYVGIYSGGVLSAPTPSPSPSPSPTASPTGAPVYGNGNFTSTSVATVGTPFTSTGWTQCTVATVASGITYTGGISGTGAYSAATAPPATTYTPIPGTTPAAVIVATGGSAPGGTASPTPSQVTVPAYNGSANVAQFGQLLNNYNAGDYYYNGLCQNVTVADPLGASITAYVFESTNEASKYVENLIGTMSPTSSTTLSGILYMENIETSTVSTDSAYRKIGPITIPTGTTTIFLGMWTSAGSSTGSTSYSAYWWVSNFTVTNN